MLLEITQQGKGRKQRDPCVCWSWLVGGAHPLLTVKGQQRQDKAPPQVSLSTDVLGTHHTNVFLCGSWIFFFSMQLKKPSLTLVLDELQLNTQYKF